MTATNHDGHKQRLWRPQKRFLKTVLPWILREFGDFLKVCQWFFKFSLLWPSWYTLWPSWFVAIKVYAQSFIIGNVASPLVSTKTVRLNKCQQQLTALTIILCLRYCHHSKAIIRVHPIHLTNAEQCPLPTNL